MYLNFITRFLFNLIIDNWFKILLIIISIISFNFAGSFEKTETEYKIEDSIVINNRYLYISQFIRENKIEYKVIDYDFPVKVTNGVIKVDSYNGFNVALWVVFGISIIILTTLTLHDDGWGFSDIWIDTFKQSLECHQYGDEYHYIFFGRLIAVNNEPGKLSHNVRGFRDLNLYPKLKVK